MFRFWGILKVVVVLAADFGAIYSLFGGDFAVSAITVGTVALYVLFGGYLALLKEGAVRSEVLPAYQRVRFEAAKTWLATDVKSASGINIFGMKFYLVPGDDEMNAAAYGFNCVSITRGAFDNTDPVTLNAVLAHEIGHILNFDPEFSRAVFGSVTLLIGAIGVASFAASVFIFLLFLAFCCFRSWLGVLAFKGTSRIVSGIFSTLQYGIIMLYHSLFSLASRHAEYRADHFAGELGYGLQLSHFLALAEPADQHRMTLTDAMYRSHPPTEKRIARLERQLTEQQTIRFVNR